MKPAHDLLAVPDAPRGDARGPEAAELARPTPLHPAWNALIRHCREMRHGEIERLVIQDGLPVLAEVSRKKVRFV